MESGGSYTLSANTKYYLIGVDEVSSLSSGIVANRWTLDTSGEVSIGGNINTLLGNASLDTLGEYAFAYLFRNCSSLVDASELELPVTTLANGCYYQMFSGCTNLTKAPELPATVLAESCYGNMFATCTNLTKAPELPVTTLATSCYFSMFYNCTALTEAPELPATELVSSCYGVMFYNCTSLNYIKCLATDMSATNCLNYWVYGVGTSGTFVCSADASWSSGTSGIPSSWTIVTV